MYKLLLCWRYLQTRYLALACIISVMLGVATLIVVNSVMSGFSTKLRDRLHGILSDVVIEAHGMEGFADPQGKMARIQFHRCGFHARRQKSLQVRRDRLIELRDRTPARFGAPRSDRDSPAE